MPAGQLIAITFFCGVFFAALSTLMAIQEVVVEAAMDQFFLSRRVSVMVTSLVAFLFGVPLAINQAAFDRFVHMVTIYLGPVGAAMVGVLFLWVLGAKQARDEVNRAPGSRAPTGGPGTQWGHGGNR